MTDPAYQERMKALVFAALDTVNQQLSPAERLPLELSTPLQREDTAMDSLALLTFFVAVEENLKADGFLCEDLSALASSQRFDVINDFIHYLCQHDQINCDI